MLFRKKFYVGFALKERLVQCYSLAGIASFAVPAVRNATNAPSAVSVSRSACLYMMSKLNPSSFCLLKCQI
ncbi:hypothetical protein H5410_018835 [Solanum commersonii]|uniref:X-linked inhibitor of apoptosis protein, xiap n=2 Tax=Solanum TaxID=4107 RepID=M1A414_SOLTU|nr:hypothetical protein H5410_018835 [Solanum commersonii]